MFYILTGQKSDDKTHPAYAPSVFSQRTTRASNSTHGRYDRASKRRLTKDEKEKIVTESRESAKKACDVAANTLLTLSQQPPRFTDSGIQYFY